jgi:hypothetical protein
MSTSLETFLTTREPEADISRELLTRRKQVLTTARAMVHALVRNS